MIFEFFFGIVVSFLAILFFLSLKYVNSVNKWIIEISKFVYYLGHPLLDDNKKQKLITQKYKHVFVTLSLIIVKTVAFIGFVLIIIALTSTIYTYFKHGLFPEIQPTKTLSMLFPAYLYHFPFIFGTLIPIIIIPFFHKNPNRDNESYSSIDKLLHYVFLGNSNIARFLFRIERNKNKKNLRSIRHSQNVYVSGLARAGTTVLMQYLAQMPRFECLSYKNLPFLFLPKTWIKLTSNKKGQKKERFHKDGIMHSVETNEALEEPFWRNYIGADYIKRESLVSHSMNQDIYLKYHSFRKLVAGEKIYLAKNNNHLLRAQSLHQLDSKNGIDTQTIIPFREPYSQAQSLLNQHQLLSRFSEDEFVYDYMALLVHHDFGKFHKVPVFDNNTYQSQLPENKNSIEYWLEIWYLFYSKALTLFSEDEKFHFFCYEKFCENPGESISIILSTLDVPLKSLDAINISKFNPNKSNDIDLESKYSNLYNELILKSINKK